jgi:hypothetical protein
MFNVNLFKVLFNLPSDKKSIISLKNNWWKFFSKQNEFFKIIVQWNFYFSKKEFHDIIHHFNVYYKISWICETN